MSDSARIAQYYDRLVDRYGHDPRAVDAGSLESLLVRYRVLAEAVSDDDRTVLEVGCGFGDFGAFLLERRPDVRYVGVDLSGRMVEEGRRVHAGLDLRQGDVLEVSGDGLYDVVVAQGIFYLLGEDAEAKSELLLARMFGLARRAVALTSLSTWAGRPDEGEYRADPARLLAFGRTLTPFLVLRHDYHPGDVALYLYKERPR